MKKLSILFFLALSANAFSAITYTNDSRYLFINDGGNFYADSPSPKFSNFNNSFQASSLTAAGFSAVGHGIHDETRTVTSLFNVTFNTDEAVNLSLTGSLDLDIWQGDGSYVL